MSFLHELKRRNVFRVGIAYVVASWVLLQVLDVIGQIFELPAWGGKLLLAIIVTGFFVTLFVSWAYELTPEGLKRESEMDPTQPSPAGATRKLNVMIIALMALAITYLLVDKFFLTPLVLEPDKTQVLAESADARERSDVANPDSSDSRLSIAVLPFTNMSGDPTQDFFSDGISEELLNVLASIKALKVASRTSSFTFRDGTLAIPEIAAQLGVAFVLEGSVRKHGNRVRITAQLIDAGHDTHLWSDTYDRSLTDIFAIQSEIANAIAGALQEPLNLEIAPVSVQVSTENLGAYELYLKGRDAWNRRSSALQIQEGIHALETAVELDDSFRDAWLYLAVLYWAAPYWYLEEYPPDEYNDRASDAIDRAVELGGMTAFSAAVSAGIKAAAKGSWGASYLDDLDEALALDPEFVTAIHWKGNTYIEAGLFEEGIRLQNRCLEIDPYYVNCLDFKAAALMYLGRYDEAEQVWLEYLRKGQPAFSIEAIAFSVEVGDIKTALMVGHMLPAFKDAPIVDWIEAMQQTAIDKQLVLKRWDAWSTRTGKVIPNIVLATLGAPERMQGFVDHWVWLPMLREFRQSEFFSDWWISDYRGIWETSGFPPQCRPIREDDFECD